MRPSQAGSGAGWRRRRGPRPRSGGARGARTSSTAPRRSRRSRARRRCSRRRPSARGPWRSSPAGARAPSDRGRCGRGCGAAAKSPGAKALRVCVQHPERVGVPEGEQELAHRLAHRLDREAVSGPGLLGGQVVPAEGIGAVGVDHLPGLDHVAPALRHLLTLGVEDQAEADAVAVAGVVEEQGRLGEQGVEPAAGLVDRLADEVGGEALLELRPAPRTGSGTGQRASRRCRTRCRSPSSTRRISPPQSSQVEDDIVDVGAVEVVGDLAPGATRAARRPSRCSRPRRSRGPCSARSAAASPSSDRGRAPSRRCSPAICRSGRA